MYANILLVHPLISASVRLLYDNNNANSDLHINAAVKFLTCCSSVVETNVLLISDIIYLSRHGWVDEYATLLLHMVSGTSVQFVVELERTGRLSSLLEEVSRRVDDESSHNQSVWIKIQSALQNIWPARMSFAAEITSCAKTQAICPITLHTMVHPVVASDGHTYERDAIMELFVKFDGVSPMTKQRLDYHLFKNYCCMF
jgi:hypothetical protein